jgi:hypothetical protein
MRARLALPALAAAALLGVGATLSRCPSGVGLVAELSSVPGFAEPHTPGAGGPDEIPASPAVEALLGPDPDLNRVTTIRTRLAKPSGAPPRIVLILVPGFLGDAGSFDVLARNLVREFNGQLEVWAVSRRSNVLEDRLGGEHALSGFPGGVATNPERLIEALQFYFADVNGGDPNVFPGLNDFDINENGVQDPQLPLVDRFGVLRTFLLLAQDDMRFAAYWGVDTFVRDWKILVDEARARVGEDGLVLFGGHSLGTRWAATFAAYDFDPTGGVDPAYAHIDGVLLLEGGGVPGPSADLPTPSEYEASVEALATPGGPDVYLGDAFGLKPALLGPTGEIGGIAGTYLPDEISAAQRTPVFGAFPFSALLGTPATNTAAIGFFLDDDFETIGAFRASFGFSSNGPNDWKPDGLPAFGGLPYYQTRLRRPPDTDIRRWQDYDDPALPVCPPAVVDVSPGCAIRGDHVEPTDIRDLMATLFGLQNFAEWYFVSGRPNLDFAFGRDSSALGDESLLAVTQNANVDVPVLAIGATHGLADSEADFAGYLGSIATPPEDKEVVLIPGYAHLDVVTAKDNAAVPVIADWMTRLRLRKLLAAAD